MSEKILIVEDELIVAKDLKFIIEDAGYIVSGIASSVNEALQCIEESIPDMVLLDIQLKGKETGIDLAQILNERFIPFVYLSANSSHSVLELAKQTQPYGFMVKPFKDEEVLISLDIAKYRHKNGLEAVQRKVAMFQSELEKIKSNPDTISSKIHNLILSFQSYIPFDFIEMSRHGNSEYKSLWLSFLRIGFEEYQEIQAQQLMVIAGLRDDALIRLRQQTPKDVRTQIFNKNQFTELCKSHPLKQLYQEKFKVKSALIIPVLIDQDRPFVISFYSKSDNIYLKSMIDTFNAAQDTLIGLFEMIVRGGNKANTSQVNIVRETANANSDLLFPDIIGTSQPLLSALDYVKQVAPVDSSVLILGESGTGKEQIANYIHKFSSRNNNNLIKVNCAALPANLIESELFGHEKGSFTGAISKRIGRFEMAHGGTLFLDEIGDVPLEVQVKLLRVLQEKEIERIGGKDTIKVDVRIIAATNKNLEKEVGEGRFRMDLYYRLNVFPIFLPSLRDRKEDIPLLAKHFVDLYSQKYNKEIESISYGAMESLMAYNWQGNIRELENVIERNVILSREKKLQNIIIKPGVPSSPSLLNDEVVKTIEQIEKEHIVSILKKCNHKIYGPGGAAELLNLPPSTLTSKIKKLGISKT